MFDETLTPVVSRGLWEQIQLGKAPPLARPADLAQHTLAEEDDDRPSTEFLSWRHWLAAQGQPHLQPRRWLYLNFTYQQVQAALAGHGVALARVPLVFEALQRGELVEPFGAAGRIGSPFSYWMLVVDREPRPLRSAGVRRLGRGAGGGDAGCGRDQRPDAAAGGRRPRG